MIKKLLIIGGTGFIGTHLAVKSIELGYETSVLSLNAVPIDKRIQGIKYIIADIVNYKNLEKALLGIIYTHVVNLGGYINHSKFKQDGRGVIDTHFVGVENLVQLLEWEHLKSFVQIGSSDEYGSSPAPQTETMREMPISPYSFAKVASSQLLQMLNKTENFPATILRLFLVYGPGQDEKRFLPQVISSCLKGEEFPTSFGEQLRDFCYIDDVIEAMFLALECDGAHGEIINIASGQPVMIRTVLENVIKLIGNGHPKFGEFPYRNGENMALYANINKAKKILRWEPKLDLNTGLRNTVDHYQNEK